MADGINFDISPSCLQIGCFCIYLLHMKSIEVEGPKISSGRSGGGRMILYLEVESPKISSGQFGGGWMIPRSKNVAADGHVLITWIIIEYKQGLARTWCC